MSDRSPAILVVDDEESNRYTLTQRLQREGFTDLTEVSNGRQALDLVARRPFDLILMDIMMPEIDGYEVLRQLKADLTLRDIPVIMISALDAIDSVVRCIDLGAEDYLPKPFNATLLKARISASLERKRLRDRETEHFRVIANEKRRSEALLHAVLPPGAVHELKASNEVKPRRYEDVAVLFCDIADFTAYCDRTSPEEVVRNLQSLYEAFEGIVTGHGMEKIKTIGDAFLATAGLLQHIDDPLLASVRCGLEMVSATQRTIPNWSVRVGIHYGPVVAGIVGRSQFQFDLWGDTVNTAARVASRANVNSVFMSGAVWLRIRDRCRARSQGKFELRGKGNVELVECYDIQ